MEQADVVEIARRELGAQPDTTAKVTEGLLHETYELTYDDGRYILQISPDSERREELARGLGLYQVLAASELPVPDVVTEQVQEYDGDAYSIVERLSGTSAKDDISSERVAGAGKFLAKIHESREFDTAGRIQVEDGTISVDRFGEGSQKQRIVEQTRQYASLMRENGMEEAGKEIATVVGRLENEFPTDRQPVLCHNDFSPDNVLYQGERIAGILDFDRAIAGQRQRDVVKSANAFWMHDPCADWDVRETFYDGYRAMGPLEDSFRTSEPLYRVETLTEMVGGMFTLGELSAYEQSFYTERITEAIDRIDS